jgi:hypothetical protein
MCLSLNTVGDVRKVSPLEESPTSRESALWPPVRALCLRVNGERTLIRPGENQMVTVWDVLDKLLTEHHMAEEEHGDLADLMLELRLQYDPVNDIPVLLAGWWWEKEDRLPDTSQLESEWQS